MNGPQFLRLSSGIANGLALWATSQPQNLSLRGNATGTAGVGRVTGRLTVPVNVGVALLTMRASGFSGPLGDSLSRVVGVAVPLVFSLQSYSGLSPTVGSGADVSAVSIANSATLSFILSEYIGSYSGVGAALPTLANGLAQTICSLLQSGVGVGVVSGSVSSSAATSVTSSTVV